MGYRQTKTTRLSAVLGSFLNQKPTKSLDQKPPKAPVLLSTACPTSLASEPNIRGGAVGCTDGTGSGAAFRGIDNDQPEIKARQRHRARLDPKPRYPSKDFHHKEIAKKLRDGFRGLREKRKELNHNFKGNTEGNSYVSRRPLLQAQRTRCAQFFLFCLSLAGGRTTLFKSGSC